MKKLLVILLSMPFLLLLFHGMAMAGSTDSPLVAFSVVGDPLYVAVESPSRVWYTAPDQDLIGRLTVTSTVNYDVVTYTTAISEPYDLEFAAGYVWFTARAGHAVGRLAPSTGAIDTFTMTNPNTVLAGLDVVSGSPTRVWLADEGAGALVQLVVTSTTNYTMIEHALPDKFGATPQMYDVYVANSDRIWFTTPGDGSMGNFRPSYVWDPERAFTRLSTGAGSAPLGIGVDSGGYPWFVEAGGNRVGKFFPQTLSTFDWYTVPTDNSGLYDIAIGSGYVWFTERSAARIGRLDPDDGAIREFGLPGDSQPTGIAIDALGQVWVADMTGGRIFTWRPPYFRTVFLPLVIRGG